MRNILFLFFLFFSFSHVAGSSTDFVKGIAVFKKNEMREWEMIERKTFAIAAFIIRSFLATQKDSRISLQVNLCQLRLQLKKLLKNEYRSKKQIQKYNYTKYRIYKEFKKSLISFSLIYYLLMYISALYSEDQDEDQFLAPHIKDGFLYTFLMESINELDFDILDIEQWDFRIRPKKDEILNLEYPSNASFCLLSLLFSEVPVGMNASLHNKVKRLIKRFFCEDALFAYNMFSDEI